VERGRWWFETERENSVHIEECQKNRKKIDQWKYSRALPLIHAVNLQRQHKTWCYTTEPILRVHGREETISVPPQEKRGTGYRPHSTSSGISVCKSVNVLHNPFDKQSNGGDGGYIVILIRLHHSQCTAKKQNGIGEGFTGI